MTDAFVWDWGTPQARVAPPAETEALLREVQEAIVRSGLVYAHRWRPGDFLMSDNLALGHEAHPDTQMPRDVVVGVAGAGQGRRARQVWALCSSCRHSVPNRARLSPHLPAHPLNRACASCTAPPSRGSLCRASAATPRRARTPLPTQAAAAAAAPARAAPDAPLDNCSTPCTA